MPLLLVLLQLLLHFWAVTGACAFGLRVQLSNSVSQPYMRVPGMQLRKEQATMPRN